MEISWTIIVLGTLLQGMQCNADDGSSAALLGSNLPTSADSTKTTVPLPSLSSTKPTAASASSEPTTVATPSASSEPTKTATPASFLESTTLTTTLTTLEPTKLATPSSSPDSSTQAPTTKATSPDQTVPSSTVAKQDPAVAKQDPATNPPSQNDLVTTQITTIQSKTPNAGTAIIAFSNSPQNSPTTVIPTDPNQGTTNLNKPATTISTEVGTTQLKNPKLPTTAAPDSKSTASQSLGTTKTQTTTVSIIPGLQNENVTTSTSTPQNILNHSFDLSSSTEENVVRQACKTLGQKMKGNCTVTVEIQGNQLTANITIEADKKILPENYKPLEPFSGVTENIPFQKDDVNKDTIPDTLIAILASCGALVLILCCFAAYCTYHRRSYRKNQQHLTEELQTVENGYHDNPTLEVMEVQPEMQEKKLTMNREFNDSWIVPIDNLLKEDIPDEEDTHL